jgi:hypothetical protein
MITAATSRPRRKYQFNAPFHACNRAGLGDCSSRASSTNSRAPATDGPTRRPAQNARNPVKVWW